MRHKKNTCTQQNDNNPKHGKDTATILVLGGTGFIGRHIVAAAQAQGVKVLIGTRGETNATYRTVKLHEMTEVEHWQALLDEADIVINTVGILRQRFKESYEQVHHHAIAVLVRACANHQVKLVHVSALGLENNVKSRFLSSKRRGEKTLIKSNCDWAIVRPSLVDGVGGYGAKWLRRTAKWPIHFAPANALGLIAPINVDDLGEAVVNIALHQALETPIEQRIYELGGSQVMDLFQYQCVLGKQPPHRRRIAIPAWLARTVAHVCDLFHVTPFSFGHYELLKFDNCPKQNRLSEVLGRAPAQITATDLEGLGDKQNPQGLRPVSVGNN